MHSKHSAVMHILFLIGPLKLKDPLTKGWIAKPTDESMDIRQLMLNGALEKLINDIRVMELSEIGRAHV